MICADRVGVVSMARKRPYCGSNWWEWRSACMLEPAECCLARVLSGGEFPSHKILNSIGIPLWDVDCIIHVLESTSHTCT